MRGRANERTNEGTKDVTQQQPSELANLFSPFASSKPYRRRSLVDELVQQLSAVGDATRQVELVRQLWRVESSSTEPVLTALAGAAPAPVSKAARKALHSLRSARR